MHKFIIMEENYVRIRSICVSSFFDGLCCLCMVGCVGICEAPGYLSLYFNKFSGMDQPQRASRAQSFVVFSVSSEDSVVFSVLCGNISFLWSAETLK